METGFAEHYFKSAEKARETYSRFKVLEPVDVAEAITFLASPGAVGITGRHLRVCGQSFIGA